MKRGKEGRLSVIILLRRLVYPNEVRSLEVDTGLSRRQLKRCKEQLNQQRKNRKENYKRQTGSKTNK